MRSLLQIFQDTKEVLCRYDYYIHTQKRILHLTDNEALFGKCADKREKILVTDFLVLWEEKENDI